jgi:signal transduction histidine kinase
MMRVPRRALRLLPLLGGVLAVGALITAAGAVSPSAPIVAGLAALVLAIAAVATWQIGRVASAAVDESRAWAAVAAMREEVAGLRALVTERETEVAREREALRAKDELLAIVGHELRTPLSSIKGYGQLMSRQLATVQEQVQRLDQLIGDVLDTAGGELTLRREAILLDDLIRSAADRFRAAHPERNLELDLGGSPVIEGDVDRLSQVVDNLLSNADKYSPADRPIAMRTQAHSGRVRISVVDHGVGISREHLPRLFDRFYRVPSADSSGPSGFGLGLSIVRDLVEAHGGQVEVESDGPGTGCTFSVVLPVAVPTDQLVSAAAEA